MIQKYIDTSNTSLGMVLVIFIVVFFVVRYLLQTYLTEEKHGDTIRKYDITDNHILGISFSVGLLIGLFVMVSYKKYLVHIGSKTLLEENFYGV